MKTISIYDVNQDIPIPTAISKHRGDTATAIDRAVKKYFGKSAFFEENKGVIVRHQKTRTNF